MSPRRPLHLAATATLAFPLPAAPANAAAGWEWPVRGPVVGRFHLRASPYAPGSHRGIDIAAPDGTPVRSACSGRVAFAGAIGTSGATVAVACGGLTATYIRLASVSVHGGQALAAGETLGAVGGGILHFGVHRAGRPPHAYLDPLTLLGNGRRPPVTAIPALGRAPRPLVRQKGQSPQSHRMRLAGQSPQSQGAPGLAWVGAALMAAGVPALGLRRRRRRNLRRRWPSTSPRRSIT